MIVNSLPFKIPEYLTFYQDTAYPMGIVEANAGEDITPWLCNQSVNCRFNGGEQNAFVISVKDNWFLDEKLIFKNEIRLERNLFHIFNMDTVSHIKRALENGYYVNGYYNEKFIPNKPAYKRCYYLHDYLVIGFNDKDNTFENIGYVNGKLERYSVDYENMEKAILSSADGFGRIRLNFYHYNDNFEYKIDLHQLYYDLKDYVNGTNIESESSPFDYYGLAAYEKLNDYFAGSKFIDVRYTKAMIDHKRLMVNRMEYLHRLEYVKDYTSSAKEVLKEAETIHFLAIKYQMTGNEACIRSVFEKMNRMIQIERKYLPYFLEELKPLSDGTCSE